MNGTPSCVRIAPGYALVASDSDPEEIARSIDDGFDCEFYLGADAADPFAPKTIATWARAGFLPFSIAVEGIPRFAPKLHVLRQILRPSRCKVTKTTVRIARGMRFRAPSSFRSIASKCVAAHGGDWLCPPLVDALDELSRSPQGGVRATSFEIEFEGRIVAGEIGYCIGACYTSLSGFHLVDGAGTVQMACTAEALESLGYALWDLGMPMEYKRKLGAEEFRRSEYLPLFSEAMRQEAGDLARTALRGDACSLARKARQRARYST
jgi:Leu/Phe-tRNA-protein transferase